MPSAPTNLRVSQYDPIAMPRDVADYVVSIGGTGVLFPTIGCVAGARFQTFSSSAGADGTDDDNIVWRCSYSSLGQYVPISIRQAWATAYDTWAADVAGGRNARDSWTRVLDAQRALMSAAIANAQTVRSASSPLVHAAPKRNPIPLYAAGAFALLLVGAFLYSRRKKSGMAGLRRRRNRRK